MELGKALRRARKMKQYKLSDVKRKTGLSISFLSDLERGMTKPSLDTLEKLATCYEVGIADLLEEAGFGARPEEHPELPGLTEFRDELEKRDVELDGDTYELLLQVERRTSKPAKTKDDWMQRYYTLKTILGR